MKQGSSLDGGSSASSISAASTPIPPPLPPRKKMGSVDYSGASTLFCNKFRFFILILGTLCLTSVFSNMLTLNFTIICMDVGGKESGNHSTAQHRRTHIPTYSYTQYEKTILQWSVAIASVLATFPFSWLCCIYGAKWVFFLSGIMSAFGTALIPPAAAMGLGWFVVLRTFQGFAYACDFAVIGVLCTRWASLRENAKFIAVLTCFSPLASTFTNAASGIICDSELGWPWVHYLHGAVSLALFTAWLLFYNDDPKVNCFVTPKELSVIHKNKSDSHKNHEKYVPYASICKNPVVLAVWLNAFADIFSGYFLIIYGPTYIKQVLKYSATETGIAGAIITILHIPVKMTCGWVSDSFHCMPERKKMWIFNSIAVISPALIYIYLTFAPLEQPAITVALFGGVHAILGFNCGGFYKCGALVSRQYAEFVIATTQFIKCLVFFIAPLLVVTFVTDESNSTQWHIIFYMIAVALIIANSVFCVYATDEPAEFTKLTAVNRQNRVTHSSKLPTALVD